MSLGRFLKILQKASVLQVLPPNYATLCFQVCMMTQPKEMETDRIF